MQSRTRVDRTSSSHRQMEMLLGFAFILCLHGISFASHADAESSPIRVIKSRHFVVHTDLDADRASDFIDRMETTLRAAHDYWKRRPRGPFDCYLVDDLSRWPSDDLPYEHARIILKKVGGGTVLSGESGKRRSRAGSTIYATTQAGVVEHEVIHAYCFQTFGTGGPDWYREGIAELLAGNASSEVAAICRDETLKILRNGKPLSLKRILTRGRFTRPVAESILRNADASVAGFDVSGSWNSDDDRSLATAKVAYAESWALCYLLHHNPTYEQRFRVFGQRLLSGANVSFEDMFRPMMPNIDFELKLLGKRIADGYRADLCRWPWMKRFKPVNVGRTIHLTIAARAGFQATRIVVRQGEHYALRSKGTWRVDRRTGHVTADGCEKGRGKIEAVVLRDFELSPVEQFGRDSVYEVASDGFLYLRCLDDWHQLEDNHGSVDVRITRIK